MQTVAVVGTGLIGGSLALALRARRPGVEIVAFDRDPAQAARAVERGAADRAADSPSDAVADADLVILAVPTGALTDALTDIADALRPGGLVTDVASVKGPAVAAARETLPPSVAFVGGHPMAGAERGGMAHADALLFENAVYVLTPDGEPDPRAVWLAESVGARPVVMTADRHDAVVAAVSHLPQLAAVALVGLAAETGDDALALAAGGFRDMTRIASSPFGMWGDILGANRDAVLAVLERYADGLGALHEAVHAGDLDALSAAFDRSSETRSAIPSHAKGFLTPLAEVTLWAEDRVGFLAAVTGALAGAGLNIKDMELLRVRENEGGAFRLAFADGPTADAAIETLRGLGLRAERR